MFNKNYCIFLKNIIAFEPRTSGIENERTTNWAKITAHLTDLNM